MQILAYKIKSKRTGAVVAEGIAKDFYEVVHTLDPNNYVDERKHSFELMHIDYDKFDLDVTSFEIDYDTLLDLLKNHVTKA